MKNKILEEDELDEEVKKNTDKNIKYGHNALNEEESESSGSSQSDNEEEESDSEKEKGNEEKKINKFLITFINIKLLL